MNNVTVFTTFNKSGYDQYGRNMLQSMTEHVPAGVDIVAYTEGFSADFEHPLVSYTDLPSSSPNLVRFKQKFGRFELATGVVEKKNGVKGYNYNFDAIKFCHKVYCQVHALKHLKSRYLFWVDGDTLVKKTMPSGFFESFLAAGEYTCYLGRDHMHSECGFVGFDSAHTEHKNFVASYENIFNSGDIFLLAAWHDCVAYDTLREMFEAQGKIVSNNISGKYSSVMHPFVNTILGEYMDHLKGPERKKAGSSFDADKVS